MSDRPEAAAPPAWQTALFRTGPRALTAGLILAGIGINFANVISRYLFDFALYWAEEIMVFIIVWCVFIGAVAVAFDGAHLKMDLLSGRIPSPWKELINGGAAIAFIACGCYVVVQSWIAMQLFVMSGDVSVTAQVPMVIPHSALPIGMALMVLAVLLRISAYFRNRF